MMQNNEANPYHRNISFYGLTRRIVLFILIVILISCAPTTNFASARNSEEGFEEVIDSYIEKVLDEYHVAGAAVLIS